MGFEVGVFGLIPISNSYTVKCAGEVLLREVIRHIMAARAIHNVFKMSEFQLVITHDAVRWVYALHFQLELLL